MNGKTSESQPLRAFVRGAWLLLAAQLMVSVLVFGFLAIAARRLNSIMAQTAEQTANLALARRSLADVREEQAKQQQTLETLRQELERAREATPFVRDAINAYHAGRYPQAIALYDEALTFDPNNWYIRDLLSYSQYLAGRRAVSAGRRAEGERYFEEAVASVGRVIESKPNYLGAYVELAVYECARDRPEAALAAYDAALARTQDASSTFRNRVGEIPQRCTVLHRRLAQR